MPKRGPKPKTELKEEILRILRETERPLNIYSIQKKLQDRKPEGPSWNTVHKYIQELVSNDKIEEVKVTDGSTIYQV